MAQHVMRNYFCACTADVRVKYMQRDVSVEARGAYHHASTTWPAANELTSAALREFNRFGCLRWRLSTPKPVPCDEASDTEKMGARE